MQPDVARFIDKHQRGGALHAVGLHGLGNWAVFTRLVDGPGKANAVLMQKGGQRTRTHGVVGFKYLMQARTDERRVGQECFGQLNSWWAPLHYITKTSIILK